MYEMNAKTTDATDYIQEDVLSLRIKNERLEQEKCELLGIIQGKDKVIKDLEWQLQEVAKDNDNYQAENKELEKENAELKTVMVSWQVKKQVLSVGLAKRRKSSKTFFLWQK